MTTIVYVFGCKRHKYWMIMVQTSECVLDLQTVNLDFIVNRVCPLKVSNYSRHPVLFARYQKPTMSNNLTTQVRIYSYTLDTERIRGMSQWNFEDRYIFGKGLEFILLSSKNGLLKNGLMILSASLKVFILVEQEYIYHASFRMFNWNLQAFSYFMEFTTCFIVNELRKKSYFGIRIRTL